MKEILLTITALSPLAIGRQKPGGSVSEAQSYIPGSVIRGAIAAQMLRQSNSGDQPGGDFETLFLSEDAAIFSNAYPTVRGRQPLVLPATAVSSKTNPGFQTETNSNGGVFDTLMDRFCAEGYGHLYDPNCPSDQGRVEPYGGFYSVEDKKYRSHSAATRLLTRVGINRRRATAQEQMLYSIEALSETVRVKHKKAEGEDNDEETYEWSPSNFGGTIRLADAELAEQLKKYIESRNPESGITQPSRLRLGGSISRGLGKVSIEATIQDYQSNAASRIAAFDQTLRDRWETWKIFGTPDVPLAKNRTFFTIGLTSDAILSEQWRRTTVISPEMLCQMAGVSDSGLELHASYSSYDHRSGWNAAWGLMKDVELVTKMGSVFLFSIPKEQENVWISKLAKVERQGIGDRTSEGFGQVRICDEFHQIRREAAK
ncbi:CRISPR-associated RAMP protein Csx10 [Romeria aff. gracilis LEGE 07310]|uniref:CRISPR-associated RAMP protein Csx10 n=1 Tax=Vasconcelosia minhoensis LEGE 07310 TaxID=915328 RepID=A0A8J7A8E8_9CYAN|nr:CRISPR-associated RAMP protein Csx10 [Romeria gracilis]MBE9079037.1 CRISPR-associated RAMP protein Csx10 [Romeria aff. gracilis LEGE 07310]